MGRIYNIYDHLSPANESFERDLAKYDVKHFDYLPDNQFTNALFGRFERDEQVGDLSRFDQFHPRYGEWFEHFPIGNPIIDPIITIPCQPIHCEPRVPSFGPCQPISTPEPSTFLLATCAIVIIFVFRRMFR